MATKREIAERIKDLYYQNFEPNDAFLDKGDFEFHVATTYSEMLNVMYQAERRANRQMDGFSNIEIPAMWMYEEVVKIEYKEDDDKYYAQTKFPVYSFDWDNSANALQGVHSKGNKHCIYRKISLSERRFRQVIPTAGVVFFYLNNPKEIVFWNAKKDNEIIVQYVPSILEADNDCLLSDNVANVLIDQVLTRLFQAKNGNFIQKLDNQNPNIVPQQQVDQRLGAK